MTENRIDPAQWGRVFEPLSAKYFTSEEEAAWRERQNAANAANGESGDIWAELIGEGKALLAEGLDPDSPEALDLARRWMGLFNQISGGDQALMAKAGAMWREAFEDEEFRARSPFTPELMEYIETAIRNAHARGLIPFAKGAHVEQSA